MSNMLNKLKKSPLLAVALGCALLPAAVAGPSAGTTSTRVAQADIEVSRTTTTTARYGGWTVQCNESGEPARKVCGASYRVVDKQKNSSILVWRIGRSKNGSLLTEFVTPTDIRIEPGVAISVDDGKPIQLGYVECTGRSCKARVEVSPGIAKQFKAAKRVKVDITRLDGKVIQFSMDIPGIDKAMSDLGA